jgi:spermidine synthase
MTSWECVTVARANSPRGEIVLRKRLGRAADSVFELSWLDDERMDIRIEDIRATVGALASFSADAIVLDVDNGPGHLVYDANDAIYQEPFLEVCRTALRPPGVLAIWSSHDSDDLAGNIARVFGGCDRQPVDVTLQNRPSEYWLFTGRARTV